MSVAEKLRYTPAEYLALDRAAPYKSEYFDGEIFAMAGGSPCHNLIALNVGAELRAMLRGRPCRAYGSDPRTKVSATGLYTYADAGVICGEMELD